jgi:transposase
LASVNRDQDEFLKIGRNLGPPVRSRLKTPKYGIEAQRHLENFASFSQKIMAIVFFWDFEGVLLVDCLPRRQTITGEYYAKLIPKVRRAIKEKRRGKVRRGVLFRQSNLAMLPHVSMAVIHSAGFEIFRQPRYSPDLSPSDYFLFPKLKERLRGIHFSDDEEVMTSVNERLAEQNKDFFTTVLKLLEHRYAKFTYKPFRGLC